MPTRSTPTATVAVAAAALAAAALGATGAAAAHLPVHSWATLPVFVHTSVMNASTFSAADLKVLARFPAVTIEKWQGCAAPGCPYAGGAGPCQTQEEATLVAAAALRAINPDVAVFAWYDSLRIYANRTLNPDVRDIQWQACVRNGHTPFLEAHDAYLLHNATGGRAEESYCRFNVYDHRQRAVRDYWRDACLNLTASGLVDGCGADASHQNGSYIIGLDASTSRDWSEAHSWAVGNASAAVAAVGGVILGKEVYQLGATITGVLQEGCDASNDTVTNLRTAAARARSDGRRYVYECHADSTTEDAMAAFLAGAGTDHYWGFGPWVTPFGGYADAWLPEFDKPLGAPVADAAYDAGTHTWSRSFGSGTAVTFNARTSKGTIKWAAAAAAAPEAAAQ
jgi:hypothetical protein